MFLSNRSRTVHYFTRLFAYSLGPPSPRNYTVWHEIFEVDFRWSPKICSCKIKLSQEHRHRGLLLFFYMNGSPQVAIFYLHIFTMTKSLRQHHLLLDRYHRKKLFATLNATPKSVIGKNETLAKISCHEVYFHRSEQQFNHFTCSLQDVLGGLISFIVKNLKILVLTRVFSL